MRHPLVPVADLREELARDDGRPCLLDVRWRLGGPPGEAEFERGHLPGAAYVDLPRDLADPPADPVDDRGRHPLPGPGRFAAAMRAAGVRDGAPVVIYDDWAGRAAARCWWLLRDAGHADVRVLDGGWSAWLAAGGAVEQGPTTPRAPSGWTAEPGHLPVLDAEAAAALADRGGLVDARDAPRFRGETEPVDPVAGHVPGAANVPTGSQLRADGTFRPASELRALYAEAGVDLDAPTGAYCGSGVTATHDVLALAAVGVEAALYPGSWSGWTSDRRRPVARSGYPDA